tara:strand:+ start:21874 stop:22122 length:249 start_codon:yes stop_codon:yes gene_type:complete
MDGRKNNGGHSTKGYAGRKPKSEEIKLVERLTPLEDDALKALTAGVKSGEIAWIKLYLEHYVGRPRERKDITINEDVPLFVD